MVKSILTSTARDEAFIEIISPKSAEADILCAMEELRRRYFLYKMVNRLGFKEIKIRFDFDISATTLSTGEERRKTFTGFLYTSNLIPPVLDVELYWFSRNCSQKIGSYLDKIIPNLTPEKLEIKEKDFKKIRLELSGIRIHMISQHGGGNEREESQW